MHGYWNDAEKTKEAICDQGWMHSGDLASLDEDGYCRIVGRCKVFVDILALHSMCDNVMAVMGNNVVCSMSTCYLLMLLFNMVW